MHPTTKPQHQSLRLATGGQWPEAREEPCLLHLESSPPAAPGDSSEDPEQPHISEQTNIKTVPSVFPAQGFLLTDQFLQGLKDYSGFLFFFQSIWCFTHFKIHVHVKIGETLPQTTKFLSLPKLCAIFVQYFSFLVVNPTN